MSSTKEKLIKNVKDWISMEKEIKERQNEIKEYKKKKNDLTKSLVDIMKTNEIDCFDITGGKIVYTQTKVKSTINQKYLQNCLNKYFENSPNIDTEDIGKFILDNREVKISESIKHKENKGC